MPEIEHTEAFGLLQTGMNDKQAHDIVLVLMVAQLATQSSVFDDFERFARTENKINAEGGHV